MVIAALVSFALLLVAWILAPDRRREPVVIEAAGPETSPLPA